MEFGWSDHQRSHYDGMKALGAQAAKALPDDRMGVLAAGGALGLSIPAEYGGAGLDLVTTARAYEGLGETLPDGGVLLAAGAHLFGVAMLVAQVGTEAQKAAWLGKLASGEALATVAATEVESGSDIASVVGVADKCGGAFRLSATKRYVTWADRASVYFVVARDGREGRGLTGLLVPRATPGVSVGDRYTTAGLRGARLAPVTFTDCEVGPEALVGKAGAGLAAFQVAMTYERALVLAFRLGAMQTALSDAVRFARTRKLGGTPIARHQAVSHRIAKMQRRLEASRLLVYKAAWALDQGQRGQAEAALAKWHLAEAAVASSIDALAVRGGAGFLEESGLPSGVDDALGGSLHSGTEDVLATIVARWLGL